MSVIEKNVLFHLSQKYRGCKLITFIKYKYIFFSFEWAYFSGNMIHLFDIHFFHNTCVLISKKIECKYRIEKNVEIYVVPPCDFLEEDVKK